MYYYVNIRLLPYRREGRLWRTRWWSGGMILTMPLRTHRLCIRLGKLHAHLTYAFIRRCLWIPLRAAISRSLGIDSLCSDLS